MPVGDFDRRVTIFTKERGKIYAFAKGARRINNQMMGYARIFAYGKFKLYEGRDSYNIISADIANYFEVDILYFACSYKKIYSKQTGKKNI